MANLSKIKRDRMLAFLDDLKAQQTDENKIREINAIRNELTAKRYGLVWEEHSERVDEELIDNIPVFIEDKSREITCDENLPYNFMLEGDNLHSLNLLEKTHKGKIDLIYIDPPYNTGNKSWKYNNDYVEKEDDFRHSKFISFMRERLKLAYNLLSKEGIFICAIDDYETQNVRLILDELFGENNRMGTIVVVHNPGGRQDDKFFATAHEYMFVYSRDVNVSHIGYLPITDEKKLQFTYSDEFGKYKLRSYIRTGAHSRPNERPGLLYPIYVNPRTMTLSVVKDINHNVELYPFDSTGNPRVWRWGKDTFELKKDKYIVCKVNKKGEYSLFVKERENDNKGYKPKTMWCSSNYSSATAISQIKTIFNTSHGTIFDYPKSIYLMQDILKIATKKTSIILDFFAGSGTTGHAVMELNKEDGGNRKFILCTNNENNICEEITYQRIKTVITGKRKDGSDYSEGIAANLKYFKTGWTKRHPENYFLSHQLLLHIKEMIELQNAIKIDNKKYAVLYSEADFDRYIRDEEKRSSIQKVWVSEEIPLRVEDKKLLKKVDFAYIPREYFQVELQEVGE